MKNKKEYTSIFDGDSTVELTEQKKSTALTRQAKLTIVLLAFLAVIIPVWIFFVIPALDLGDNGTTSGTKLEAHRGEVILNNRYYGMMEAVKEKDISKVVMNNLITYRAPNGTETEEYAKWVIAPNEDRTVWGVENYKNAPIEESSIYSLLSNFIRMRATQRIEFDKFEDIDLSVYGFDAESKPSMYTICLKTGEEYKVTVGKKTPTGSGYYAYYTGNGEPRATVYIIDNSYAAAVLANVAGIATPIVTQKLHESEYMPEMFSITVGSKEYFHIRKLTDDEIVDQEAARTTHLFITIDGETLEYDSSVFYTELLYKVLREGITGNRVVYVKPDDQESIPEDVLKAYGLDIGNESRVALSFKSKVVFTTSDKETPKMMEQTFIAGNSFLNDKGERIYYVLNLQWDTIMEVKEESIEFIFHDYIDYAEHSVFLFPIYSVTELKFDSTLMSEKAKALGLLSIKEGFEVWSKDDKFSGVNIHSTGKAPIAPNSEISGKQNFLYFYRVIISTSVQTELKSGSLDGVDLTKPDVILSVKTTSGKTHELKFYVINSSQAYYTLDGIGRTFVNFQDLERVANAADKLLRGEQVRTGYDVSDKDEDDLTPVDDGKLSNTEIALIITLVTVVIIGSAVVAVVLIRSRKTVKDAEKRQQSNARSSK